MSQYVINHDGWESWSHTDISGNVMFQDPNGNRVEVPGELVVKTAAEWMIRHADWMQRQRTRGIEAALRAANEELGK